MNFYKPLNSSRYKGFTLLEVLISLAILSTALIALSGSITEALKGQSYLKEKTFAHYIATHRLAELRLQKQWPNIGVTRGEKKMLQQNWLWKQEVLKTDDDNLRRIEISISHEKDEEYQITKLVAFMSNPG